MNPPPIDHWQHDHSFHHDNRQAERNTHRVILLTLVMMVIEILGGWLFGSMALLADGWHMGTHVFALGITAAAYIYSRRHAADTSYSYGTGKVGVLSGYTSAILLAGVAALMIGESIDRLLHPNAIHFNEALLVAVIGLIVNLASAAMLHAGGEDHGHHHGHSHHHDHNLKAAYLHVIADALTSVTAIVALLCGKYFGWMWLDPAMGIVGAVIIGIWAWGLMKDTSSILLDRQPDATINQQIREALESDHTKIADLHVRHISPHALAAEISLVSYEPFTTRVYKEQLNAIKNLQHTTIEVHHFNDITSVSPSSP
ncbi:CDF family Co(II)/Ni(II) efflux transporter DmeF [Desulfuromonas acetoxidans]|uniref:Cation diffusion facilitator family transporter n=1 Tax=Desulfuromonas acetoxidans (strain DSM 684 / 11070) TaxID=281689 RepID=Q1JWM6_DESA6|nr:CDF family Co(II)/Ni(II) efflux transporter DmeF [Desulfuromonas acetoxidans]EAT14653.1 cation diffusion facilitator family transporter [Desulfuromonas acetoxidans DSM 684]MBF0645056.1 CDF family Co(II)/Ni(II) efflux transporter DmeF [Desulfuromonas acetoxidans]NVD23135.1 CDF family Co(II)/Ni(II) efflux transporter DmeF [Desulfuromonas acetoxidans]NVE15624.1 CDF family Co(II)/Ni(II) efflux transporter DmeF [Desulfuromonas acetoxidans]